MSPFFVAFAGLFFVGGLSLWLGLFRVGGLAFGFRGLRNVVALFRDPSRRREQRFLALSFLVACAGGLGTCGAVMAGDAKLNRACAARCRATGYETGLMRGNPHADNPGRTARECWCRRGETWADDALR